MLTDKERDVRVEIDLNEPPIVTSAGWKEIPGEWGEPTPNLLPEILDRIKSFLLRYLVFKKPSYSTAIALWAAHTWVLDSFDFTPYLRVSSPTKRCGKSRLFDCLELLCAKPWSVVSPTGPTLFRKIQKDRPTLLLDELDKMSEEALEAICAVLNAGFYRGAIVPRCVGPQHDSLAEFSVFCAKAFAGIDTGKLPDTVADRSIEIAMVRRARSEVVQKFRKRDAESIAKPLRAALETWSQNLTVVQQLHAARPKMPDELDDRAADICEPLLAIADMAGGAWPAMARTALVELCSEGASEQSTGVQLLGAIREIFAQEEKDRISTHDLLHALIARDNGEPWATWWEEQITKGNIKGPGGKVAFLLKKFDVIPGAIRREDGTVSTGYKRESFEDAFYRYLS